MVACCRVSAFRIQKWEIQVRELCFLTLLISINKSYPAQATTAPIFSLVGCRLFEKETTIVSNSATKFTEQLFVSGRSISIYLVLAFCPVHWLVGKLSPPHCFSNVRHLASWRVRWSLEVRPIFTIISLGRHSMVCAALRDFKSVYIIFFFI